MANRIKNTARSAFLFDFLLGRSENPVFRPSIYPLRSIASIVCKKLHTGGHAIISISCKNRRPSASSRNSRTIQRRSDQAGAFRRSAWLNCSGSGMLAKIVAEWVRKFGKNASPRSLFLPSVEKQAKNRNKKRLRWAGNDSATLRLKTHGVPWVFYRSSILGNLAGSVRIVFNMNMIRFSKNVVIFTKNALKVGPFFFVPPGGPS